MCFVGLPFMNTYLRIACACALALCVAPLTGNSQPQSGAALGRAAVATPLTKVQCWQDCWHDEWRSHHRWGSDNYWHNRWRSHFRWGSGGGWYHNRWESHYRPGSYHRYWDHRGYDDYGERY